MQRARAVRDGRDKELVFVEGVRLCEEAVSAGLDFESVFYTAALADDGRGARLLASLRRAGAALIEVGQSVVEFVSDTKTSQGVVALARRPETGEGVAGRMEGTAAPLVVIMHGVNNPSNAGAMLRVAEASGATAAVATRGSADLFSPKALRGSMGSAFRLPLWTGADFREALSWCAARGVLTVATEADAAATHTEVDWTAPRAVILGPEAGGLTAEEVAAADARVRVPMRPPVESLNVSVALAVILYEAARQRNFR